MTNSIFRFRIIPCGILHNIFMLYLDNILQKKRIKNPAMKPYAHCGISSVFVAQTECKNHARSAQFCQSVFLIRSQYALYACSVLLSPKS